MDARVAISQEFIGSGHPPRACATAVSSVKCATYADFRIDNPTLHLDEKQGEHEMKDPREIATLAAPTQEQATPGLPAELAAHVESKRRLSQAQ